MASGHAGRSCGRLSCENNTGESYGYEGCNY